MDKRLQFERFQSPSKLTDELIFDFESLDFSYFPYPWKKGELLKFLNSNSFELCALKYDAECVGFILWATNNGDSFAHLLKILVSPEKRGQGLGHDLLNYSLLELIGEGFTRFYLEVGANNQQAISVYLKNQFRIIHTKKSFYSDGADALIMVRELDT